jgi:hypothetical protein
MREFFCQEVKIPSQVSEYLGAAVMELGLALVSLDWWSRKAMKALVLGPSCKPGRQLAAWIAIKEFGRLFVDLGDFNEPGDADDDLEGLSVAGAWSNFIDIFDLQAARGPRLGNQVYGGTANFNSD